MTESPAVSLGFSASYARLVADYVRARDLDSGPILRALGLTETDAAGGAGVWVPARRLAEALHLAAGLCADPNIGLHIGQQVHPANIGSLGYALTSCTDLGDGLALYDRLQSLVCNQVRCEHRLKGDVIETTFETLGDVPSDTQLWTFALVSRLAFARWVVGRKLSPLHVWMRCPAPADPKPLLDYVGCPITFDAEQAADQVPTAYLQLPNPHADADLHKLMSSLTTQQWVQQGEDQARLVGMVRQRIALGLQRGSLPLLDSLAPELEAELGLSARQLQRRLGELGLNFKELVEQVRKEQVLRELRHTTLPLADIAQRAAYAEVSSMHRAVRRWTGLTPLGVRDGAAKSRGSLDANAADSGPLRS